VEHASEDAYNVSNRGFEELCCNRCSVESDDEMRLREKDLVYLPSTDRSKDGGAPQEATTK
jgi:hypothetical protein